MRFGAQTVQQNVAWSELLEFWRFLEQETRVESIWAMDHLVAPIEGELPEVPCFESWTMLAAAAQATRRLRIGCLVTANTFRHPALLAKMAATLDHISDGRLVIALGAGWHEKEHRAFGIPLHGMRERLERFDEAAALLRAVMEAGKPVTFHGSYYRLKTAPFLPGFVQKPHPPLLFAGPGKRMLSMAGRYGDLVYIPMWTQGNPEEAKARAMRAAEKVGRAEKVSFIAGALGGRGSYDSTEHMKKVEAAKESGAEVYMTGFQRDGYFEAIRKFAEEIMPSYK